ncbi:hypothetical protein SEPCBS119000_000632 [Sporothrix epigloea]|uniref:Uncharacterized protein n=1 Tax=Sporothrix epigloea TaxID=1892477 RepID=A0ABP0D9Z6_9PEZI
MSARALSPFRTLVTASSSAASPSSTADPRLPLLIRRGRPSLTVITDLPASREDETTLPVLESPFWVSTPLMHWLEMLLASPDVAAITSPWLQERMSLLAIAAPAAAPAGVPPPYSPPYSSQQSLQQSLQSSQTLQSSQSPQSSQFPQSPQSLQQSQQLGSPIPLLLRSSPSTSIRMASSVGSIWPDSPYPHFGFGSPPRPLVYLPNRPVAPAAPYLSLGDAHSSATGSGRSRRYPASPYPIPIRARDNAANFGIGPASSADSDSCSDDEDGGVPLRGMCTEWEGDVFYIE